MHRHISKRLFFMYSDKILYMYIVFSRAKIQKILGNTPLILPKLLK